jgi:hypothetical protein
MKQPKISGDRRNRQDRKRGRSKDARGEALERKGTETCRRPLFDLDQLPAALRGTRRAYYAELCNSRTTGNSSLIL